MKRIVMLASWLLILALLAAPTGAAAGAVNSPADLTFQKLWIYSANNATGVSLAMDSSGTLQAGFTAYSPSSGKWPAYYAACSANCSLAASWTTAIVGDVGAFGGDVRLAVTSTGHPRLMWFSQTSAGGSGSFNYAECSSACTSASQWSKVQLNSDLLAPENSRYFALNRNDSPRFVYKDIHPGSSTYFDIYYASCSSSCTTATNWSKLLISSQYQPVEFSMALDASGGAHLAFRDALVTPNRLVYAGCAANCTSSSSSWSAVVLPGKLGSGEAISLALDAQGHTRLAVYFGYLGSSYAYSDRLSYWFCDSTCSSASSWGNYYSFLPADYGKTVDLAIDAQGLPHLAFNVDSAADSTYGLGYAACSGSCQSPSAAWQGQLVESTDDLDASNPVTVAPGCSLSAWMEVGLYPSIVLDASGSPQIGYDAAHYQGGSCSIHADINLVRLAITKSGTNPLQHKEFIPKVVK